MPKQYHVEIWGDFVQSGESPGQIRAGLVSLLKKAGHSEVNFDIKVDLIDKPKEVLEAGGLDKTPEPVVRLKRSKKSAPGKGKKKATKGK